MTSSVPTGNWGFRRLKKAGLEFLAVGNSDEGIQVLEGTWPFNGLVVIEKYDSMDALLKFWNSPEYRKAKKLRDGLMDCQFYHRDRLIIKYKCSDT